MVSWTVARAQSPSPAARQIGGVQAVATSRAVANFSALAAIRSAAKIRTPIAIHRPLKGRAGGATEGSESEIFRADPGDETRDIEVSRRRHRYPVRAANFSGPGDTGSIIPPDTQGTVGPNNLMVTLNDKV